MLQFSKAGIMAYKQLRQTDTQGADKASPE